MSECYFCGHAVHGPGGCDNCAPKAGCNQPPAYARKRRHTAATCRLVHGHPGACQPIPSK